VALFTADLPAGIQLAHLGFLVVLTNKFYLAQIKQAGKITAPWAFFFSSSYLEKKTAKTIRTVPRAAIFVCPPEGGLGSSWLKHASKQRSPTTLIGMVGVCVPYGFVLARTMPLPGLCKGHMRGVRTRSTPITAQKPA
jgi:hypothetical protein